MPTVTLSFLKGGFHSDLDSWEESGNEIRDLVAAALSTDERPLNRSHVDLIPLSYPGGTLTDYPISVTIETIGYPDRKAKLTKEAVLTLKEEILKILRNGIWVHAVEWTGPLIWIKYVDQDGCHV